VSFNPPSAAALLSALTKSGKAKPKLSALSPAQRVDRMLRGIRAAGRNKSKLTAHLKREVSELRAEFTPKTMHKYLCWFRRVIAEEFGPEYPAIPMLYSEPAAARFGFEGLGFTEVEVRRMKADEQRRIASRLRDRFPIEDPLGMVARAAALIRRPGIFESGAHIGQVRWDRMTAGILLLTGRRPIEVLVCGSFAPIRGSRSQILFGGQAKTRFAPGTRQAPYRISVLAPARDIIRAIEVVRQVAPPFENTSQRLSECVAQEFPTFEPRDLRAAYATISYHAYAPESQSRSSWNSEALGHKLVSGEAKTKSQQRTAEIADIATAAYYEQFYIPGLRRHRIKLPTF